MEDEDDTMTADEEEADMVRTEKMSINMVGLETAVGKMVVEDRVAKRKSVSGSYEIPIQAAATNRMAAGRSVTNVLTIDTPDDANPSPRKKQKRKASIETWCEQCKKSFKRLPDFERHMARSRAHQDNFEALCEFCNSSYSREDALLRHQRTCKGNPRSDAYERQVRRAEIESQMRQMSAERPIAGSSKKKKNAVVNRDDEAERPVAGSSRDMATFLDDDLGTDRDGSAATDEDFNQAKKAIVPWYEQEGADDSDVDQLADDD